MSIHASRMRLAGLSVRYPMIEFSKFIVHRAGTCGDQATIRGRRFTIEQVLAQLAENVSPLQIADEFDPDVDDICGALREIARLSELIHPTERHQAIKITDDGA